MILEKEERHEYITTILNKDGKVKVTKLAHELNVTPETIRRDLAELEDEGQCKRIHGGAIPYEDINKELAFERKLDIFKEEKMRIAKVAAARIQNGDHIAIDVGTTTIHIADMINGLEDLTVVTNSLAAAHRFNVALEEKRMTGKVMVLGGFLNPEQFSMAGTITLETLNRIKIDKAFLSCGGVSNSTVFDYDFEESLVSSKMLNQSSQSILLVDSSKIGVTSYFSICSLLEVNEVISDAICPIEWQDIHGNNRVKWTTV